MVASVSALSSAGQAASYYEADDYYAEGGMAPSEWFGESAEKLGLSGEVDREKFAELLEGRVAGQQLGTTRDGKVEHRPGWDITLSAPKSVSIMAEVAGDKRLIKAHGAAVKVALVFAPASASFSTPMICSSVNLSLFISSVLPSGPDSNRDWRKIRGSRHAWLTLQLETVYLLLAVFSGKLTFRKRTLSGREGRPVRQL
jgi:hypothetical protein